MLIQLRFNILTLRSSNAVTCCSELAVPALLDLEKLGRFRIWLPVWGRIPEFADLIVRHSTFSRRHKIILIGTYKVWRSIANKHCFIRSIAIFVDRFELPFECWLVGARCFPLGEIGKPALQSFRLSIESTMVSSRS